MLFTNTTFRTLIVSMLSTYVLYLVASLMFLDPWHMVTSFLQYLLLTPTYLNILNVYAFCNTHDITWGTKGDDKPEKLPAANLKPGGRVDVAIPTDDADLNTQYESELRAFSTKWTPPKRVIGDQEKHEDYYKGFRSAVVLAWMFCNLVLAAVVLNVGGVQRLDTQGNSDQVVSNPDAVENLRAQIYLEVVLYSVAGLAAIRFIGAVWFLVIRIFRGI
jgi:chitin synthase